MYSATVLSVVTSVHAQIDHAQERGLTPVEIRLNRTHHDMLLDDARSATRATGDEKVTGPRSGSVTVAKYRGIPVTVDERYAEPTVLVALDTRSP